MTKFSNKSFSVGSPNSEQYRKNFDNIDWNEAPPDPEPNPPARDSYQLVGPGPVRCHGCGRYPLVELAAVNTSTGRGLCLSCVKAAAKALGVIP